MHLLSLKESRNVFPGRNDMRIAGKEIKDECVHCGEILECELFKQGHGIRQERMNVVQMISCQMKHRERRNEQ